jgi:hypothetical protein
MIPAQVLHLGNDTYKKEITFNKPLLELRSTSGCIKGKLQLIIKKLNRSVFLEHVWLRGSVHVSYGSIKTSCLVNSYPRFQTSWGPHKLRSKRRISKNNYLLLLPWLLFRKRCNFYQKIN